jgi:hypothetical protein
MREPDFGPQLSTIWASVAACILAALVGTCTAGSPSVPTPATQGAQDDGPLVLHAEDAGLSLDVEVVNPTVAPGEDVRVKAVVRNGRPTPVRYMAGCEGAIRMSALAPLPLDPVGRPWPGIGGEFKAFTLDHGYGAGGRATDPMAIHASDGMCGDDPTEGELGAGGRLEVPLDWPARYVAGVPVLPGAIRFHISFGHDPLERPAPSPWSGDGPRPLLGSWNAAYRELAADGSLTVAGEAPRLVTAGEAIDVALSDARFAAWLAWMPSSTWSNANLRLKAGGGGGIVPDQPSWSVELFREIGVPRNWAIAYVDPFTGALLGLHFCDIPCDR